MTQAQHDPLQFELIVRDCEGHTPGSWINTDIFEKLGLNLEQGQIDISHGTNHITRMPNLDLTLEDNEITLCPPDREALHVHSDSTVTIRRHPHKK